MIHLCLIGTLQGELGQVHRPTLGLHRSLVSLKPQLFMLSRHIKALQAPVRFQPLHRYQEPH